MRDLHGQRHPARGSRTLRHRVCEPEGGAADPHQLRRRAPRGLRHRRPRRGGVPAGRGRRQDPGVPQARLRASCAPGQAARAGHTAGSGGAAEPTGGFWGRDGSAGSGSRDRRPETGPPGRREVDAHPRLPGPSDPALMATSEGRWSPWSSLRACRSAGRTMPGVCGRVIRTASSTVPSWPSGRGR